jgi:very-short-patch-repair endonuclease
VIEIDGGIHFEKEAFDYDNMRDRSMKSDGIEMLRFANEEVLNRISNVLITIKRHLGIE